MFKQGEYRPLLTWWLGDGSVKWSFVEKRRYKLRIALSKELKHKLSQMLPSHIEAGENYLYISGGRELFAELVKAAGRCGQLLDVLQPHKWLYLNAVERSRKKRKRPDYVGGRRVEEYIDLAPGEASLYIIPLATHEVKISRIRLREKRDKPKDGRKITVKADDVQKYLNTAWIIYYGAVYEASKRIYQKLGVREAQRTTYFKKWIQ